MKIVEYGKVNPLAYGLTTACDIYYIHIKVEEHAQIITDLISLISNSSWLKNLDSTIGYAYQARAQRTIPKMVEKIQKGEIDKITSDSGEYIISYAAHQGLARQYLHKIIPLAEIWKEKALGNPGFDFHTENPRNILIFGESKYTTRGTPHNTALNQIIKFIQDKKDSSELSDLKNFICEQTAKNCINGNKGYAAAFSLRTTTPKGTILFPLKNNLQIDKLLQHQELYLIGVEI
ncbi:MAG: hypothetical protein J6J74_01800 [Elusimicrobiaceae bacterium]|nr:hypothetical protein [Elusimicrobiaceae bacterium]